jgi:CheY-like chemotaxis protein
LGQGSEFIVRLPVLGEPDPVPEHRHASPPVPRALRILIVDDNKDSADSMAMLQEIHGHEVRTASNGPEALEIAAAFSPEVVLLDIGLPGMDGYEVAQRLRAMPAMAKAFLIALTGYGTTEDRLRALQAGFDEHLAKPADLETLRQWLLGRS